MPGVHFKDRVDPADASFRLVELRIPHNPAELNYGPFEYHDADAAERLRRFCVGYLSGFGDVSDRDAQRIIRESKANDARRSGEKP